MEEGLLVLKEREEEREIRGLTWSVLGQEVKSVGWIAGPMVAVTLSQYMLQVVCTMMVGHLGELSLSSTAIAISLAGVSGFSFLVSLLILLFLSRSLDLFLFVCVLSFCVFLLFTVFVCLFVYLGVLRSQQEGWNLRAF